jgi:hypothetical protein
MKARFANSASYRWLNKEVLETYVLDDMESTDGRFKVMLPQGNYMVRSG